LGKDDDLEL